MQFFQHFFFSSGKFCLKLIKIDNFFYFRGGLHTLSIPIEKFWKLTNQRRFSENQTFQFFQNLREIRKMFTIQSCPSLKDLKNLLCHFSIFRKQKFFVIQKNNNFVKFYKNSVKGWKYLCLMKNREKRYISNLKNCIYVHMCFENGGKY